MGPFIRTAGLEADPLTRHSISVADPLRLDPCRFAPEAPGQAECLAVRMDEGVTLAFITLLSIRGLHGGVGGFRLAPDAPQRLINPALRRRAEFTARMLAAHCDGLNGDQGATHPDWRHARRALGPREAEAMRPLAEDMQTARIGDAMTASEPLAAHHPTSARNKLGARTREQAVAMALRRQSIRHRVEA